MAKAKDFNTLSAAFIIGQKCTASQITCQGCSSAGKSCLAPMAVGAGPFNSVGQFAGWLPRLGAAHFFPHGQWDESQNHRIV